MVATCAVTRAKSNLGAAQRKTKSYDRRAKDRLFAPGDRVLALLPLPGSSLQARFSGPYAITKKVGDRDYVIATPDQGRRSRLCHVHMLKPYNERGDATEADSGLATDTIEYIVPTKGLSSAGLNKPVALCVVALSGGAVRY